MQSTTYDVTLNDVEESNFKDIQDCQAWINKLITFLSSRYQSPSISVGAYLYGSTTYVVMDITNVDPSKDIAFTIGLKPGCIQLPTDIENCTDLVLTGIVDAFLLIDMVVKATSGSLKISTHYH